MDSCHSRWLPCIKFRPNSGFTVWRVQELHQADLWDAEDTEEQTREEVRQMLATADKDGDAQAPKEHTVFAVAVLLCCSGAVLLCCSRGDGCVECMS